MESIGNDDELRKRAEKRVSELMGFYTHLVAYVVGNTGIFLINYFTSRDSWWFFWPLFGWGIGLICHGIFTFIDGPFSASWKEREIKKIMKKYKEEEA
jgi:phosphotransferase system  glucose/maltose/N-acetylglucosamine-specific IIC component